MNSFTQYQITKTLPNGQVQRLHLAIRTPSGSTSFRALEGVRPFARNAHERRAIEGAIDFLLEDPAAESVDTIHGYTVSRGF